MLSYRQVTFDTEKETDRHKERDRERQTDIKKKERERDKTTLLLAHGNKQQTCFGRGHYLINRMQHLLTHFSKKTQKLKIHEAFHRTKTICILLLK